MHCVLLGIGLEIGEFLYRYRDIVEPHFKQNDNTFVRCVNIISLQCTLCSDIDIYVCDMNILMHIFMVLVGLWIVKEKHAIDLREHRISQTDENKIELK